MVQRVRVCDDGHRSTGGLIVIDFLSIPDLNLVPNNITHVESSDVFLNVNPCAFVDAGRVPNLPVELTHPALPLTPRRG